MARTVRTVLVRPRWLAVGVLAALVTVAAFAATASPLYVQTVVLGEGRSPLDRVQALWRLFPFVGGVTDPARALLTYGVAALVGTNVAVLGHHLTRDAVGLRGGTGSALGVAIGALGAGCAACGVAVVAGILGVVGGTAALAALPWHGAELLALALVVNVLSLHWLAEGARGASVGGCPVDLE